MDLNMVLGWVKKRVGPDRYRHTLGVMESVRVLAGMHGAEVESAVLAAAVHDCARDMSPDALLNWASRSGILIGTSERMTPVVLHAPVGAEIVRRELGIVDEDVLRAIRVHCTGMVGMSVLDKVLFVADMIEPGRCFPGVEEIRALALNDLQGAIELCFRNSIQYLIGLGCHVHEDTLRAWIDVRETGGGELERG